MNNEFWNGKRVLITGHTGFKGAWLSLWLQKLGAVVHGVALEPSTTPSLFQVANVASGMGHCIADVRDFSAVLSEFSRFRPEIVFHLAAQPLVRYSYLNPIETYGTNVMGTLHVLEVCRQTNSVKAIVNVTTDKCYKNQESLWGYREHDRLGGHDPYSSSKACSEILSAAYRSSYFANLDIALATARAGNVIGGGDWSSDRLVPDILRALDEKVPVPIRSKHAIRPWQHVLEPLSGYLMLAEGLLGDRKKHEGEWNFGPHREDEQPVAWIADQFCQGWGGQACWEAHAEETALHETGVLRLDITKALSKTSWKPRWNLSLSIANIISWHQRWRSGHDMREVCLSQIAEYESLIHSSH